MKSSFKHLLLCGFAAITASAFAQTQVPIPPTLSGSVIGLNVQAGTTEIYPGIAIEEPGDHPPMGDVPDFHYALEKMIALSKNSL